jgi:hypothetical protein
MKKFTGTAGVSDNHDINDVNTNFGCWHCVEVHLLPMLLLYQRTILPLSKCQVILVKNAGSLKNIKSETTAHAILKFLQEMVNIFLCFHNRYVLNTEPVPYTAFQWW